MILCSPGEGGVSKEGFVDRKRRETAYLLGVQLLVSVFFDNTQNSCILPRSYVIVNCDYPVDVVLAVLSLFNATNMTIVVVSF